VKVCLQCGAEVSPSEHCSNCGASLTGTASISPNLPSSSSASLLVKISDHVKDLTAQKKKYKVAFFVALTAAGAFFVLSGVQEEPGWVPFGFLCLLGLIPIVLYIGFLRLRLISAGNDEAKLLRIIASADRICAQSRSILSPDASRCSSCGSEDLRIEAGQVRT
jgi:ribosomal protein L40E